MLAAYAKRIGARKGWYFLSGNEYDLTSIRFKLFRLDDPLLDFSVDIHASMLRIIQRHGGGARHAQQLDNQGARLA
jgi:hypothetical protein